MSKTTEGQQSRDIKWVTITEVLLDDICLLSKNKARMQMKMNRLSTNAASKELVIKTQTMKINTGSAESITL